MFTRLGQATFMQMPYGGHPQSVLWGTGGHVGAVSVPTLGQEKHLTAQGGLEAPHFGHSQPVCMRLPAIPPLQGWQGFV
jgi:hypothetical protein